MQRLALLLLVALVALTSLPPLLLSVRAVPSSVSALRTPVPQIGELEFEALAHGDLPILVEFFAPWCHYCKQMEPLYEQAAVQMRKQATHTQLVKVDCMEERDLCARFQIGGFPSIKLIRRAPSAASAGDAPSDPSSALAPLSVFEFELQRTTLSFLVFCSTMWRTMEAQPFPELEPEKSKQMKEEWEALQLTQQQQQQQDGGAQESESPQQQQDQQQADPIAVRAEPTPSQPPRPAAAAAAGGGGKPIDRDLLAGIARLNIGAQVVAGAAGLVRNKQHRQQQQRQEQAQQGMDAAQAGVGAAGGGGEGAVESTADGSSSGWSMSIVLVFLLLVLLALVALLLRFGPLLRSKMTRHHSLQLSKTV